MDSHLIGSLRGLLPPPAGGAYTFGRDYNCPPPAWGAYIFGRDYNPPPCRFPPLIDNQTHRSHRLPPPLPFVDQTTYWKERVTQWKERFRQLFYRTAPGLQMEKEAHPKPKHPHILGWQQEMAGRTTISCREEYPDDKHLRNDWTFEDTNYNWTSQDKGSYRIFQHKKVDWSSKDNNSDWTFQDKKLGSTSLDKNCAQTLQIKTPNRPSEDRRSGLTCQEDEAHTKASKGIVRASISTLFLVILQMWLLMKQQKMAGKTTSSEKKKVLDKTFYLMEQTKQDIELLKKALKPDRPGFVRIVASIFALFLVVVQISLLVKVPTLECFCYIGIPFLLQITHFQVYSSLYPPMFCMEGWQQFGALIVCHTSLSLAHLVCSIVD